MLPPARHYDIAMLERARQIGSGRQMPNKYEDSPIVTRSRKHHRIWLQNSKEYLPPLHLNNAVYFGRTLTIRNTANSFHPVLRGLEMTGRDRYTRKLRIHSTPFTNFQDLQLCPDSWSWAIGRDTSRSKLKSAMDAPVVDTDCTVCLDLKKQ